MKNLCILLALILSLNASAQVNRIFGPDTLNLGAPNLSASNLSKWWRHGSNYGYNIGFATGANKPTTVWRTVGGMWQYGSLWFPNKDSIPLINTPQNYLVLDTITGRVSRADAPTSGTYTPTVTTGGNIDTYTAYACQYMRVGSTVTVSGKIDVDCTTAATDFSVELSLPVTSNFTSSEECGGTGAYPFGKNAYAIYAKPSATRVVLYGNAEFNTSMTISFNFTYQIK